MDLYLKPGCICKKNCDASICKEAIVIIESSVVSDHQSQYDRSQPYKRVSLELGTQEVILA